MMDVYGYDGDGVARARQAASSPHIDERTLRDIVGEIIRQKSIKQGHANAAAKRMAREARLAPPAAGIPGIPIYTGPKRETQEAA